MNSCLYEGRVRHRRTGTVSDQFHYPLFMAYLDLDELPELFDGRLLFSARRPAPAWFRRADHLGDPRTPLRRAVQELVRERTGVAPEGPIRLLTHLRYLGHFFNPVSFYYCFDAAGERVQAVVAHVTNTPWGETHSYVMAVSRSEEQDGPQPAVMRGAFQKRLHVSPLMGMDHVYDWRLSEPAERLSVHIESTHAGGGRAFDATLSLARRELSSAGNAAHAGALSAADAETDGPHLHPCRAPEAPRRSLPPTPRPRREGREGCGGRLDMSAPAPLTARSQRAPAHTFDRPPSRIDRLARMIVLRLLSRIRGGELVIIEDSARLSFGECARERPLSAVLHVRSASFYRQMLRGSVGLGEAYVHGLWDCDDLVSLTRIAALNVGRLDSLRRIFAPVLIPVQRWARWLARNTPGRARKRIAAHYDLGNELFSQFLDPTMMYSCAVFESPEASLEEASLAKLERVCSKLELGPADHVLEIGTGWGGFAIYAAANHGCRVTTTTISAEQHTYATERVREAGLQDRVTVLLEDYRELRGRYDKLVSIEMIEAVGWQYFPTFFRRCSELVQRGRGDAAAGDRDRGSGLRGGEGRQELHQHPYLPRRLFAVAPDHLALGRARHRLPPGAPRGHHSPLRNARWQHWRERFAEARERLAELGYDERFRRLWDLYLSYCEGGFRERRIQDVQLLLAKPRFSLSRVRSCSARCSKTFTRTSARAFARSSRARSSARRAATGSGSARG